MNDCKTRSGRAFDRQAWTYDTARFGSHARGLYPVLLEQLVQIPHGSVLDVGCGTGELLREVGLRFPETARTGLDLSANMLAVAREKLGGAVELVQGDAERLPFADGRFEVLLCNDSFHHYPNPGAAAAEFARVLQPGGVLLLGDCTAPAGLRGGQPVPPPVRRGGRAPLQRGGAGRPAGTPLPRCGVPAGGALQLAGLGDSVKQKARARRICGGPVPVIRQWRSDRGCHSPWPRRCPRCPAPGCRGRTTGWSCPCRAGAAG